MTLAARHWHAESAAAALKVAAIRQPLADSPMTWEAIGTGGNCEAWAADCFDGAAQIWICSGDQTLGDRRTKDWLVGLHPRDGWNDQFQTSAETLAQAVKLARVAEAARAFALGFRFVPLWENAFPDFPRADLPAIPATWQDSSWHNDACPCFEAPNGLRVFTDRADPEAREGGPDCPRYSVQRDGADGTVSLHDGDDWQAVLAFVTAYVPPAEAAQTAQPAPVTPTWEGWTDDRAPALKAAAILARDTLREQMAEMLGDTEEGRAEWPETVFWPAYDALCKALA